MIIYYSGESNHWARPEIALQEEANIMLTFYDSFTYKTGVHARFHRVWRARVKEKKRARASRKSATRT